MKTFLRTLLALTIFFVIIVLVNSGNSTAAYDAELSKLSDNVGASLDSQKVKTVAVVNFTDLNGKESNLGKLLAEDIAANLVNQNKGVTVLDLANLPGSAGKPKGDAIDALITGKIIPLDQVYRVEVKVIALDSGKLLAATRASLKRTPSLEALLEGPVPAKIIPPPESPAPSPAELDTLPKEGLSLWLKADAGMKTDNLGRISEWDDQSSNGNNASQPTTEDRPLLVPNGLHGKPVLQGNGSTYLSTNQVVTSGQDYSVFVVSTLGGNRGPFYNGDSGWSGWGFDRSLNLQAYGVVNGGLGRGIFSPIQNPDAAQLLSVTRGSGVTSFYAYGVLWGTTGATMNNPAGVAYVGAVRPGQGFNGIIAEVIVYDRKLNDEERQHVEAYLATKYDLKVNEPSSVTLETAPPKPWNHDDPALTGPPLPEAGLSLWLKADDGVKTDEHGHVSRWVDHSLDGNDARQTASENQPVLIPDESYGNAVVQFDGSTYLQTNHVVTSGQDYSAFVVSSLGGIDGPFYNGAADTSGWGFCRDHGLDAYGILDGGNAYLHFGTTENLHGLQLLSATRGSGLTRFYTYGTLSGTSNAIMAGPAGVASIGAVNPPHHNFTGSIAEIIVYNRKVSDEERQQVEAYLVAKYDLKLNTSSSENTAMHLDDPDMTDASPIVVAK